jgi:hypothetical protein
VNKSKDGPGNTLESEDNGERNLIPLHYYMIDEAGIIKSQGQRQMGQLS